MDFIERNDQVGYRFNVKKTSHWTHTKHNLCVLHIFSADSETNCNRNMLFIRQNVLTDRNIFPLLGSVTPCAQNCGSIPGTGNKCVFLPNVETGSVTHPAYGYDRVRRLFPLEESGGV
jgi:hypothetical protein